MSALATAFDFGFVFAFVTFVLRYIFILCAITSTAWAAGWLATLPLRRADAPMTLSLSLPLTLAIGLACLAQAALLLALVGALRRPIIIAAVFCLHVAAFRGWRWRDLATRRRQRRHLLVGAALAIAALPLFLLALYPPLGFDETLYHLPFARAFAATGRAPFLPVLRFPIFPPLAEMLNASVLLLAGDVATQLVGWLAFIACVALAFVWARELSSSTAGGAIAAATLVGSPLALYLASAGYIEPLLALFGLASLYAATRAQRSGLGGVSSSVAWAVAAGALAGSAAGVKYLGLFFVPAGALLLLRTHLSSRRRILAAYALATVAALAPTYGRLLVATGNPLFPLYPNLFGSSPWDGVQVFYPAFGLTRLWSSLTLLWDGSFRRQLVGGLPFVSPVFVLGVPLTIALALRRRSAMLGSFLLLTMAYTLLIPPQARYWFGIAPLFSVAIGVAAAALVGRRAAVGLAVAATLVAGGEAYALYRLHRLGLPPASDEARERFLAAEQPLYPAVAFINRASGPVTIYGVDAEQMVYYAAGTWLGDFYGPTSYERVMALVRARGSVSAALDDIGASHLLIPHRASSSSAFWSAQAAADRRLERMYDDGAAIVYRVLPPPEARLR